MIFRVRPIPSCPGYFVSDTGRAWGPRKELKLRSRAGKWGRYLSFRRCLDGRQREVYIHHLVAEAFLGPKPPGAFVCHRNDIPNDNRLSNLYYGNASTNGRDAFRNGRFSRDGEHNARAKLTWIQVGTIRAKYALGNVTQTQLAKNYGIAQATVSSLVRNQTWATV